MLLSSLKARLRTFFRTTLIKFYHHSQLMTDPIYRYCLPLLTSYYAHFPPFSLYIFCCFFLLLFLILSMFSPASKHLRPFFSPLFLLLPYIISSAAASFCYFLSCRCYFLLVNIPVLLFSAPPSSCKSSVYIIHQAITLLSSHSTPFPPCAVTLSGYQ